MALSSRVTDDLGSVNPERRHDGLPLLRCYSSPAYFAPLPPGHVFPMDKFPQTARAVSESGIGRVIDPGRIGDRDLLRVHTADYVRSIRTGEYNEVTRLKLGLPWTRQLSDRSHAATAGTLAAARAALEDGLAANLAGGTHHAFPDSGQGFCVFNDVAVAIRALQADDPWYQIMVIDLDAHQGNATHFIFAGDPNVFTYSLHVGRNYPSNKHPGTMDVELERYAPPEHFFSRLESTLPGAVERFEPDLVFYIAGVDVHGDDRFGQMTLTTRQMARRDRWTIDLCRNWGIPTCVVYGGGYNRTPGMTAQLHLQTIRIASERLAHERLGGPMADGPEEDRPEADGVEADLDLQGTDRQGTDRQGTDRQSLDRQSLDRPATVRPAAAQ